MPINVEAFCEGTSVHGLAELYRTKSVCWKLLWILVIFGFIGITGYQVFESIEQFVYQEPSTVFVPATKDDLIHEPITLCVPHWLSWLSGSKSNLQVKGQPVNSTTVLYALSYLTPIYRVEFFDENDAAVELENVLKNSQLTLDEFFVEIARDANTFPKNILTQKELMFLNGMYQMCYSANESTVDSLLGSTRRLNFKIIFFYQDAYLTEFVQSVEYAYYVMNFCKNFDLACSASNIDKTKWDQIDFPYFIIVEKYNRLNFKISRTISEYLANLKVTEHKWKNNADRMCVEGKKAILSEASCYDKCLLLETADKLLPSECVPVEAALFLNQPLDLKKTCRNKIHWVSPSTSLIAGSVFFDHTQNNGSSLPYMKECLDGCDKFYFDLSASAEISLQTSLISIHPSATTIKIKYSTVEDMVIIVDMDMKTWEDFVGTVGGLLGVWTGASIMSIIQMVYLCFFVARSKDTQVIPVARKINVDKLNAVSQGVIY